jgi:putative ATP-binding cassette transporter
LAREEQDQLLKHFRAITEGIKELKLNHQRRQAFFVEELQATATASRRYNVIGSTVFSMASSWGLLTLFLAIGILLFGFPKVVSVERSVLSSYALVTVYLILPLEAILSSLPILSRASVALKKIETLGLSLGANATEKQAIANHPPLASWNSLELSGITHAYQGEREESGFTLGPVDLTFHPGEVVFIVGGNGSGKSTLAKLILGLYSPETGEILLDGKVITDENREWYRQHFSAVFSDFYLFERLLGFRRDNLDPQAEDYLTRLQLEHKVQVKDGQLSTTLLSQGQRKRLTLLTAYLEDRPIYLFDEWASDQDPVFKAVFYIQLLPELKRRGKAVLVISHDDHYFHLADRIVKLDYGKLEYDKRTAA